MPFAQTKSGMLHFEVIGYVVVGTSLVAFMLLRALVRSGPAAS